MAELLTNDDYGVISDPATLTIQRLLPGPIDRIWSYLTDSDRRRLWLAAGTMEEKVGAPVELVWRNDELTDPPGDRPEDLGDENRMACEVTAIEPPHLLAISWGSTGGVTFKLEERSDDVMLTIIHKRVEDPAMLLSISAGWHIHIDVLEARLRGKEPTPFWDNWAQKRADYAKRLGQ